MNDSEHSVVMVTGAAGFFGHHIAMRLLQSGKHVVVFDKLNAETTSSFEKNENLQRLMDAAEQHEGAAVSVYRGDLLDDSIVKQALAETKPTAVVHAASMVDDRRSVKHPTEYVQVNTVGTQKLLQAIVDNGGITQVVYISTRSTFGQVDSPHQKMTERSLQRPINPYGASKVGAEAMCHVYHHIYGLNVNIIRIFALYGPRGRPDMIPRILVNRIHHQQVIHKFGTGEANRDWLYVCDAAEAVFAALHTPRGFDSFNIGSGHGTSLNALIETAEQVVGQAALIKHMPVPAGDAHFVGVADNSHARDVLGWRPETSLEQGLRKTFDDLLSSATDAIDSDQGTFLFVLKRLMIMMMLADQKIQDEEVSAITDIVREVSGQTLTPAQLEEEVLIVQQLDASRELRIQELMSQLNSGEQERLLRYVLRIAHADGVLDSQEEALVSQLQDTALQE